MAKFAWLSVPLSLVVSVALQAGSAGQHTREGALAHSIILGFFIISGVVCGIVALCGIPKYGAKGILWPALTGICLWLLLALLAIPTFMLVQKKAEQIRAARTQRVDLAPAVHTPGAERLEDTEFGFSFDIPAGYRAVPSASTPKQYRYLYGQPSASGAVSVVAVVLLQGAKLPGQHLTPADVPAGKGALLDTFSWRGLPVDGFRVSEPSPQGEYITFNVQIPLKKRTVQIGFGGPATKEAETRALATRALSTLEGEPNWP